MILDYILIKGWEIINSLGYLSIPILVCFAQIFGYPTEVTIPMIFKKYNGIIPIILVVLSDFTAFLICFFAAKSFSFKFNRRILSKKEILLYRMIPLIRGGMIPLMSFGYELKDLLIIALATSFIWSVIFYFVSFFFNLWFLVDFVRKNERYLMIFLFGIVGYKGVKMLKYFFQRK